ncbi:hypothetical protein [Xenorhabdus sp. PB30.3]|uniref:hypothetical protein n=1 Tax=Xenorhabdus sp. PB30.3 TaxID=2788941 RepID=UPI001E2F3DB2|nr:hypothetical protein [Xenorhabdus sp. PB30.3]MCC8380446.1 hypothetical protein [Xenorhabdus sp. PB30.3]
MTIKETPQQIVVDPEELLSVDQIADKQQQPEEDLQLKILSILDQIESNTSAILRRGILAHANSTVQPSNINTELASNRHQNNIESTPIKYKKSIDSAYKNQNTKTSEKVGNHKPDRIAESKSKHAETTASNNSQLVQQKHTNTVSNGNRDTERDSAVTTLNHTLASKDKESIEHAGTERHSRQVEISDHQNSKIESSLQNTSDRSQTKFNSALEKDQRKKNDKRNHQPASEKRNAKNQPELDLHSGNREQGSASQEAQREQKEKRENSGLIKVVSDVVKNFSAKKEKMKVGDKTTDAIGSTIGGPLWEAAKEVKEAFDDVKKSSLGQKVFKKITGKKANNKNDNHANSETSIPNTETQSKGRRRDKHGRFVSEAESTPIQENQESVENNSNTQTVSSKYQGDTYKQEPLLSTQVDSRDSYKKAHHSSNETDSSAIEVSFKHQKRKKPDHSINESEQAFVQEHKTSVANRKNTQSVSSEYQNNTSGKVNTLSGQRDNKYDKQFNKEKKFSITEAAPKDQKREKHERSVGIAHTQTEPVSLQGNQKLTANKLNTQSVSFKYQNDTHKKTNSFSGETDHHDSQLFDYGTNVPAIEGKSKPQKSNKYDHSANVAHSQAELTPFLDGQKNTANRLNTQSVSLEHQNSTSKKERMLFEQASHIDHKSGHQTRGKKKSSIADTLSEDPKSDAHSHFVTNAHTQVKPALIRDNQKSIENKKNTKSVLIKHQKNTYKKEKTLSNESEKSKKTTDFISSHSSEKLNSKTNSDISHQLVIDKNSEHSKLQNNLNEHNDKHIKNTESIQNRYSKNTDNRRRNSSLSSETQQHRKPIKSAIPYAENTKNKHTVNHANVTSANVVREREKSHRNDVIEEKLDKQLSQSQKQHKELIRTIEKKKFGSEGNGGSLMSSVKEFTDMFGNKDEKTKSKGKHRKTKGPKGRFGSLIDHFKGSGGSAITAPKTTPTTKLGQVAQGIKNATGALANTGVGKVAGGALKTVGSVASRAAAPVAALATGYFKYNEIKDREDLTGSQKAVQVGATTAGSLGGASAGAAMGATIGSVVPVVGTLIGGLLGAAVGGWLGSKGGDIVGEAVSDRMEGTDGKTRAEREAQTIKENQTSSEHSFKESNNKSESLSQLETAQVAQASVREVQPNQETAIAENQGYPTSQFSVTPEQLKTPLPKITHSQSTLNTVKNKETHTEKQEVLAKIDEKKLGKAIIDAMNQTQQQQSGVNASSSGSGYSVSKSSNQSVPTPIQTEFTDKTLVLMAHDRI